MAKIYIIGFIEIGAQEPLPYPKSIIFIRKNVMTYNPYIHHRRSIRLKGYDYSQSGAYFVTLCIQNRRRLLGKIHNNHVVLNEYGELIHKCWEQINQKYPNVDLDHFIVMPNHLHGIIIINNQITCRGEVTSPLLTHGNIIAWFK